MVSFVRTRTARLTPAYGWSLRLGLGIIALLFVVILQLALSGRASADDVIASNITIGGVPVGGLDSATAKTAIEQQYSAVFTDPITLTLGSRVWTAPAAELGAQLDITATLAQAFNSAQIQADSTTRDLPLILSHDRADADAALQKLSVAVSVPMTNADILLDSAQLTLVPDSAGTTLDTAATWQNIISATAGLPFGGVAPVITATIAPTITVASIQPVYDKAQLMAGQPITLTAPMSGTLMAFTVQTDALRSLISIDRDKKTNAPISVSVPATATKAYADMMAQQVNHTTDNAKLLLPDLDTEVVIQAETPGRALDVKSTVKKLTTALSATGAKRTIALPVTITQPKIVADDLNDIKSKLDAQINHSIDLHYTGVSYTLAPKQLVPAIYLNSDDNGSLDAYSLRIEDKDLARVIRKAATSIDVAAVSSTYRLVRGRAMLVQAPSNGLSVDQAATLPLLHSALENNVSAIDIPVNVVTPDYGFTGLSSIATPDKLAQGQTFYGYSSPERNWNVTLGAARLDGWYIAPGSTFSFNDALGPLTLAAGFKMGWAIQVQGGSPTTIPSEAGGICQVATTLFQSAFWSGLDITDRRNHSYWIATYGQAPSGMQGLDATVSPPDQDFQFRNNTGHWLLIRAHGDGQNINVSMYGTSTGWQVNVDKPVITNVIEPDRTPLRQYSDALVAGRELKVETAQPGFKSSVTRHTLKDGQVIDDYTVTSTYLPSRDTWMVGTKQ